MVPSCLGSVKPIRAVERRPAAGNAQPAERDSGAVDCESAITAATLCLMAAANGRGPADGGRVRRASWIAVLLTGLVVTLSAIGAASGRAPRSPAAPGRLPRSVPVKAFSLWLDEAAVRATTKAQWASIARRNSIVVLNSWDFRLIPVLKQANPSIRVWVYKDLSGVRSDDCATQNGDCGTCRRGVTDSAALSSGMGYCWVKRNHPDWLLAADHSGRPFQFRGYPDVWETNYGSLAYQRRWIRDVRADASRHRWDGVEVDNALTTADAYGVAAMYPTSAAVQAATYAALRRVGPALTDAGLGSVVNVGYATAFPGLWQRWLGPVEGLEQEFYLSFSTQPNAVGVAAWARYQDEVSSCAAQRKTCWFHAGAYSAAVTSRTRQYALASYLLATDGRQFLAAGDFRSGSPAPSLPLGPPLGAMKQMGPVWVRYFASGIAVTNPSDSASTVRLGGSYLDDGHRVSVVTLGPASGIVLRAAPARGQR
jgi:Hypothetical glycosyl hydrolase family 15